MNFVQNKYVSKIVLCLCISLMLLCSFTAVNASTEWGIEPYAYDEGTYTFQGSRKIMGNYYDGTFMAIEATATASDNQSHKVTISVIIGRSGDIKNYTVYTNGQMKKFDYIYLGGISKGSDVIISCSCDDSNATVTIRLKTYSW